jgi:hypothetical protein
LPVKIHLGVLGKILKARKAEVLSVDIESGVLSSFSSHFLLFGVVSPALDNRVFVILYDRLWQCNLRQQLLVVA